MNVIKENLETALPETPTRQQITRNLSTNSGIFFNKLSTFNVKGQQTFLGSPKAPKSRGNSKDASDDCSNAPSIFLNRNFDTRSRKTGGKQEDQYFVGNLFVERIFDNIKAKQESISENLEAQITNLTARINTVMDVREVDVPMFEDKLKYFHKRLTNIVKIVAHTKFNIKSVK